MPSLDTICLHNESNSRMFCVVVMELRFFGEVESTKGTPSLLLTMRLVNSPLCALVALRESEHMRPHVVCVLDKCAKLLLSPRHFRYSNHTLHVGAVRYACFRH